MPSSPSIRYVGKLETASVSNTTRSGWADGHSTIVYNRASSRSHAYSSYMGPDGDMDTGKFTVHNTTYVVASLHYTIMYVVAHDNKQGVWYKKQIGIYTYVYHCMLQENILK